MNLGIFLDLDSTYSHGSGRELDVFSSVSADFQSCSVQSPQTQGDRCSLDGEHGDFSSDFPLTGIDKSYLRSSEPPSSLEHHFYHSSNLSSIQKMANSTSPKVALAAGTHIWEPTPESEAFQDEILQIIRAHGITKLDTARSYVRLFQVYTLPQYLLAYYREWVHQRLLLEIKTSQ
jgi:hypothetical protein